MKNKKIKILLLPFIKTTYYENMLEGLAEAFRDKGHHVLIFQDQLCINELKSIIEVNNIDLIISINKMLNCKTKFSIPIMIWIQDLFLGSESFFSKYQSDNEYIYTLGTFKQLGYEKQPKNYLGVLNVGVNPDLLKLKIPNQWDRDFSICGFLQKNAHQKNKTKEINSFLMLIDAFSNLFLKKFPNLYSYLTSILTITPSYLTLKLKNIVKYITISHYKPLSGNLDINKLSEIVNKNLFRTQRNHSVFLYHSLFISKTMLFKKFNSLIISKIDRFINYTIHEFTRYLDRQLLANLLILNFPKKIIHFFGHGWANEDRFKAYSFPNVDSNQELVAIYRSTKINIHNNTHGIGLHSRVLECIACGGFIMTHRSLKHDYNVSGILKSFDEDKHFAFYDPKNFYESTIKWLINDNRRNEAIKNARKIILKKHLWSNRASQILNDYLKIVSQNSKKRNI